MQKKMNKYYNIRLLNIKHTLFLMTFFLNLNAYTTEIDFFSADEAVSFALHHSQTNLLHNLSVLSSMKIAAYSFQDFLPSFSVSLTESDSAAMNATDSRTKNLQFSITQQLFDGGKKKLIYDLNKINTSYSLKEYEQALNSFKSEIINQYYTLLMQKELLIVKEDLVNTAKKQLEIIEKEYTLGLTLETDYIEYLISYIQIEEQYDQCLRDLLTLERKFKKSLEIDERISLNIKDSFFQNFDSVLFEPFLDILWVHIKSKSIDILKQTTSLFYSQKQLDYNNRWYLPSISLQGGVTFSGVSYPLTEPKYSLKININFSNNTLLPINISNSYGFDQNRLSSVSNSLDAPIDPRPTYALERQQEKIAILQAQHNIKQTEQQLYEIVIDTIANHDSSLRSANITEKTIELLEKRLQFSKHELDKGEIKHIDYLKELITLAEKKITLLDYWSKVSSLERSLEILAQIPFGELNNVCTKE